MSELVGKHVTIEITCVTSAGRQIDRFQTSGTIEVVNEDRIGVRREGLPELFGLPPDTSLLEPAGDDYAVSLTVSCSDPEAILQIRGLGFVPQ